MKDKIVLTLCLLAAIALIVLVLWLPARGAPTSGEEQNVPPQELVEKIASQEEEAIIVGMTIQQEDGKRTRYLAAVAWGKYAIITFVHRVIGKQGEVNWTFWKNDVIEIIEYDTKTQLSTTLWVKTSGDSPK